MMRRLMMVALTMVVLGMAGTAEARQPRRMYSYGYDVQAAPQRTVRVRRARANRQGFFARMMELERRKNAWLAERFGLR